MHLLFFALALSVQQAPQTPPVEARAPVAPAAAAAETPTPAEDDPEERIVCRREHVVGSNRRQQVCMSVRQRSELRDESRRQADRTGRGNDRQDIPVHPVSGM